MSRQINLGQIVPNVQIGTTTTLPSGQNANVENIGTGLNPILNFSIPQGIQGPVGPQGEQGVQGEQGIPGPQGEAFTIKKTYSSVAEMNADFDNMNVGDYVMIASDVEVEDNAKLYTKGVSAWIFITDFSGATGIQGEQGPQGIQGPKGEQGIQGPQGIQGETGNGIVSVVKTSTEGLVDTYTITYTNGTTSTFQVTNGEDGETPLSEFNKLKHRVSDLERNQPTYTATGTEIHVEDAHETEVVEDKMSKVSSQETTTGKNKFNSALISQQENYNTYDKNTKLWTTSSLAYTYRSILYDSSGNNASKDITKLVKLEANKTYTLKLYDFTSTSDSYKIRYALYNSDGVKQNAWESTGSKRTITTSDNDIYLDIQRVGSDYTFSFSKIMIVEGEYSDETMPNYEPYTGGQPSPNPDYPQEIKTVKGYKNEFDENNVSFTTGVLDDNGVNTGSTSSHYTNNYYEVKPNTEYIISGTLIKDNSTSRVYFYDKNKDWLSRTNTKAGNIFTFTTPNNCYYVRIQVSILVDLKTNDVLLTEGTEELPYVPYGSNYVYKKIVGKNLFDVTEFESKLVSGKILNDNGVEINDNTSTYSKYLIPVKANTTYYRKGAWQRIYFYNKNKEFVARTGSSSGFNSSFSFEEDGYIGFQVNNSYWASNKGTDQIELGVATSYEPYKESIITIPLNGNEIAGIGNYKDELIVDSDGHCYLQKNTRWLELAIADMNRSDNYPGWNNVQQIKDDYPNVNDSLKNKTNYFSNITTFNNGGIGINTNVTNKILFLDKSIFNLTQNEWKEQYPDLVFKLLYALQTPEIIDLNYDVDIRLFQGINNISNSDDMDMEIKYVQDISTIISNINNAILEIGGNE